MIYHWDSSQSPPVDIHWGMPPLGTTIEPGRTWWESTDEGEIRSDIVAWEIFQSIIALLAAEELNSPSSGGAAAAPTHVTWLLAS